MNKEHLEALNYHRLPNPGKLAIIPTKPMLNQRDLALAYSPGVAIPCQEIAQDAEASYLYTNRSNMVAVITNGTAVLGLGNIGPYAAKPVMEGKSVLFKKFADLDSFDIEINETDPDKLVEIIASLDPSFGGINLEDIKAPDCFYIEKQLNSRLKIPVFHDDQHGTAIIVTAAILNSLKLLNKEIAQVKMVVSGAGAAALACLDLLVSFGLNKDNVIILDRAGVVYVGREGKMDEYKQAYATTSAARTVKEAFVGADIFLGLSVAGTVTPEMIAQMVEEPIVLALANPVPEILPAAVKSVRPAAIIATGRTDYPNQVNNVLCFPYIMRGALDVGATCINAEMKKACVNALAALATSPVSDIVANAYGGKVEKFGREMIIPKPFDPRLITCIPPAVAAAAMASGVATRPLADLNAYRNKLSRHVYRSGFIMRPLFENVCNSNCRIAYSEGEDSRVLQAAHMAREEQVAYPVLVGRREVILHNLEMSGLDMVEGKDFDIVDYGVIENDYSNFYQQALNAKHWHESPEALLKNSTAVAAFLVKTGRAAGMVCGLSGDYDEHIHYVRNILGLKEHESRYDKVHTPGVGTMYAVLMQNTLLFICDAQVEGIASPEQIASVAYKATKKVATFGITPRVALLSHRNFNEEDRMTGVRDILVKALPEVEIEGPMQADVALMPNLRQLGYPNLRLSANANLLVMPSVAAANITYNVLRSLADAVTVGPITLGLAHPAHVVSPATTARGILNVSVIVANEAMALIQ